mgnify:CR=1 FL=1
MLSREAVRVVTSTEITKSDNKKRDIAMAPRLLLLRHGQITANRVGRWHGSTDSPLTLRGRWQAWRTGRYLSKNETFAAVYTSLLRLTNVWWVSVLSTLRLYCFGVGAAVFPASVAIAYVTDPL